jgi:MFS family permease
MAADGIRWVLFYFFPAPSMILTLNVLHGLSVIGMLFVSAMYLDSECEESVRSTAQALLYLAMVAGQITGYLGGSVIVNHYHFLPRADAIRSGFFWFGQFGLLASLFCLFFVAKESTGSQVKTP